MNSRRVFITGSNRGIGLALARHLAAKGHTVFAAARRPEQATDLHALARQHPGRVHVLPLDVTDEASIAAAAAQVRALSDGLDWLINNAGVLVRGERWDTLDPAAMSHAFRVNAIGPLIVAKHFVPLLRRGRAPLICQMTSVMGSISLTEGGGYYSYRGSKAALNMMSVVLAHELRPLGIAVVLMHPGWVRTDMGGAAAPLDPATSAQGIVRVLESVTLADSGRFLTWEGRELPW